MVEYVDSTIFVDSSSPQNISVRHVFLFACLTLRMRCYQEITALVLPRSRQNTDGAAMTGQHTKLILPELLTKSACGYISNETVVLCGTVSSCPCYF